MLNNIDLSKIRIFNEVYKCLNIHRASENLQITPSAVSQTLKNLELELGEQLFVRTRQKIIATELGEAFFEKIIPLAVGLEQGLENFYENMGELQGQLSIGAPNEFGRKLVLPVFKNMRKKFTDSELKLEFGNSNLLIPKLLNGDIHLAFVEKSRLLTKYKKSFKVECVQREEFILVAGAQFYEDRVNVKQSFNHLMKLPHILYLDSGVVTGMWYQHNFKMMPTDFIKTLVVEDVHTIIEGVLSNLGLAMVPKNLVQKYLTKKSLVEIKVKRKNLENEINLVYLESKNLTRLEKIFIQNLKKIQ